MGIDKFINDYIDGDLTPEDDKEFRKLLEEDASAQEELDLMTSLISALREDAQSIVVPKSLEERVEQNALATYLKVVPPETFTKKRKATVVLALFLMLFLFSIYGINDSRITYGNSFFIAQVIQQQDLLQKQVPTNTEVDIEPVGKESTNKKREDKSNVLGYAKNVQQISFAKVDVVKIENEFEKQIESQGIESFVEKFDISTKLITSTNDYKIRSEQNVMPLNRKLKDSPTYLSFEKQKHSNVIISPNEIQTDGVFISGYSTIPLNKFGGVESFNTYSQGFGYKVGKNLRIGLEFGYFDFDFKDKVILLVPGMLSPAEERKIFTHFNEGKSGEKILTNNEDNSYTNYVQVEIPATKKYQQYWGSLFFDYEYQMRYTSIIGRIKVGATSDGFLGGLGVFAEIRPVDNLSLNFGIENKTFWSSMPNEANRWKNILSLVYGLSVNFKFNNN